MLNSYTAEEFVHWYPNAWVKVPNTDKVGTVYAVSSKTAIMVLENGAHKKPITISLKDLTWDNIRIPDLGYRNLGRYGKNLVHMKRTAARMTEKGFSRHTIRVREVPEVISAMGSLGLNTETYRVRVAELDAAAAKEGYTPTFKTIEEAISGIRHNPSGIGYAINNDVAVVMGIKADGVFLLLWKTLVAAKSTDGRTWKLINEDYRDCLNRSVGKLNYE